MAEWNPTVKSSRQLTDGPVGDGTLSLAAALIGGLAMIGDPDPTSAVCMRAPESWGQRLAGVFVVAIDPSAFGDAAEYHRHVGGVLDRLQAVPPPEGVDEILVPGEPERRYREQREREGIPVPANTCWAASPSAWGRHTPAFPGRGHRTAMMPA